MGYSWPGIDYAENMLMSASHLLQERFRSIVNSYYRGAHGVLLVYDLTDPSTAQNLHKWLQDIEKYAGGNVPIVIVGNKSDAVASADPEAVAHTREIIGGILASYPELTHYECSAKMGHNVEDVFVGLVKKLMSQRQAMYDPYGNAARTGRLRGGKTEAVRLNSENIPSKYFCCSG